MSRSRSRACSRRAWSCTRPIATRPANGCRRRRFELKPDSSGRRAFALHGDAPIEIGPIEKMSKSKRNTVDPDEIIASYGADTARWFMLSDSPPDRDVIWTEAGVQGAYKQTQRLWRLTCEIERIVGAARPPVPAKLFARGDENPANGACRAWPRSRRTSSGCVSTSASPPSTNSRTRCPRPSARSRAPKLRDDLRFAFAEAGDILVHCFAPMMPHLAEECWSVLGHETLVAQSPWPAVDRALIVDTHITMPVQVNGRKRADLTIERDADSATVEAAALALDAVRRAMDNKRREESDRRSAKDRQCRGLIEFAPLPSLAALVGLGGCFQPLYGEAAHPGIDGRHARRGGGPDSRPDRPLSRRRPRLQNERFGRDSAAEVPPDRQAYPVDERPDDRVADRDRGRRHGRSAKRNSI